MKIYLVRRKNTDEYLLTKYNHLIYWVSKKEANIYHTSKEANDGGKYAFDFVNGCEDKFEIIKIDTDEAILILRDLFKLYDLGNLICNIAGRKLEVIKQAEKLIKDYETSKST